MSGKIMYITMPKPAAGRLYVDLSVFALPNHAVGRVHGVLELEVVPRQGELISFSVSKGCAVRLSMPGFTDQARIEHVLHRPQAEDEQIMLLLEPVTLNSLAKAASLMKFLDDGFHLYADEY